MTAATRRWYEQVSAEFELESHHLRLLQLAGETWDRLRQASAVLDKTGLVFTDRHGSQRPRPEVKIEHDCKTLFARLLRELGLDVRDPDEPRPPRLGGKE